MPRIIGICGRRRCGKDTIANFLNKDYGYDNKKISTDLKRVIQILFGFSDAQVESDAKDIIDERWGLTPRKAMQFFGTEVMQYKIQEILPGIDNKFWIKSFIKQYNDERPIVISDLRFLHEFEELKKIKSANVFVIRVEREIENMDQHISENDYLNIPTNTIIDNNGSLDDLYEKIRSCLVKLNDTRSGE